MDPFVLRNNVRVKMLAGVIVNLAAVLFGAAFIRVVDKRDVVALIWFAGSLALYWAGNKLLDLLMAES